MKSIKKILIASSLSLLAIYSIGQRVRVIEGTVPDLKNEKSINTQFTYDNMGVGKFNKEEDYVKDRTQEYNFKEAGKGDDWAKKWLASRKESYEPKFDELLAKYGDLQINNNAKYTLIFHTVFIEPGFNAFAVRKNAYINAEVLIVETANKDKVLAKISVDKSPGKSVWGNDYDTSERISEAYAAAGKAFGKFLK